MVIDTNGKVGIGTASPSADLDVDGNINFTGNLTKGGLPFGEVVHGLPVEVIYRSSGNVGIGTTSPGDLFTVGNNSSSNTGGTTSMSILAPGENADAIIYFGTQHNSDSSYSKKAAIIAEGVSTYSRSKLHFCLENTADNTSGSASLSHSRMAILNNGNVGIGTTSPQSLLDIHKMHANTGLYESDGITFTTESSSSHLAGTFWSLGYIGGYHLANNGTAAGYAGGLVFKTKPANSTANYSLTTTMVLDAAGNLGIGQTNPTYKLDVSGTGRFTGNLTAEGDLTVTGNLTINGTTTTVNSTTMTVDDPIITLGGDTAPPSDDNKTEE